MKRRNFLSLLGAATTVPMLPALPAAATTGTVIKFNQFTYGLAALHIRIEPGLSVAQIARRFRLPHAQAEALAQRLINDGFATRSDGILRANRPLNQTRGLPSRAQVTPQTPAQHSPLLTHLHRLCSDYGLTLSPRANAQRVFV